MAITKEQAVSMANVEFHTPHERGERYNTWRRSGRTNVWKTKPDKFLVPVKFGLHRYGYVSERGLVAKGYVSVELHLPEDCPDNQNIPPGIVLHNGHTHIGSIPEGCTMGEGVKI